jgi:hypothetical protein
MKFEIGQRLPDAFTAYGSDERLCDARVCVGALQPSVLAWRKAVLPAIRLI